MAVQPYGTNHGGSATSIGRAVSRIALLLCMLVHGLEAQNIASVDSVSPFVFAAGARITAGSDFGIDVWGSNFDTVNDKVMLIPRDQECGEADPPPGSPGNAAAWAALSCDHPGSGASALKCRYAAIYASGTYSLCVCDDDGNASAVLPPWKPLPPPSGCAVKERYFISRANSGTITIEGPTFSGTLPRRAGVTQDLTLAGTDFGAQDRIRITHGSATCTNRSDFKPMHPSVASPVPTTRDEGASDALTSVWRDITVFEAGSYQVCWCGQGNGGCDSSDDFVVQAAELAVSGPMPTAQSCVTGVPCTVAVRGFQLDARDRILIIAGSRDCGNVGRSSAHIQGADGARAGGDSDSSLFGSVVLARSGDFKVCWCGAFDPITCPTCCTQNTEFNMLAVELTSGGPTQGLTEYPPVGVPFAYTVSGWGLSNTDRISIVDGSTPCASSTAHVMSTGIWANTAPVGPPATTTGSDPDNRTTATWGGIVLTKMQQYRVCWCARFHNNCQTGPNYALDIGLISPRGPQNLSITSTVPGQPFRLHLDAAPLTQLSVDDRIRIVRKETVSTCGFSGTEVQAPEAADTVCFPTCVPTATSEAPVVDTVGEAWDPVVLTSAGIFKVCWCSDGNGGCDSAEDFVVDVGEIVAAGVATGHVWACVAFIPCDLEVTLLPQLQVGDQVQLVEAGSGRACGLDEQVNAAGFSRGTRILGRAAVSFDGSNALHFSLGDPHITGFFQVCYCQQQSGCTEDLHFFQTAGTLTVSGVEAANDKRYVCYLREACVLNIQGTSLLPEDALVLNTHQVSCGIASAQDVQGSFSAEGFFTADGSKVYLGSIAATDDQGVETWAYNLGEANIAGRYRMCYCANRNNAANNCQERANYRQDVGQVYVRGTAFDATAQCSQGESCTVVLRSHVFSQEDHVLLVDRNWTCGDDTAEIPWWMPATKPSIIQRDPARPELYMATYTLPYAGAPGDFRVCYCAHIDLMEPCVAVTGDPSNPGPPNKIRFANEAGSVKVFGAIKAVAAVTTDTTGAFAPLPSTFESATVQVDMLTAGPRVSCVATSEPAPNGFLPRRSDLVNCSKNVLDIPQRQRFFPRCWGTGKTMEGTQSGWNQVHIPLTPPSGGDAVSQLYVWCYADQLCHNDQCVMPASNVGAIVALTGGLESYDSVWSTTIDTPFSLRLRLMPDFDIGETWPRVKVVQQGSDCHLTEQFFGVSGVDCLGIGPGKCEPAPVDVVTMGSWGTLRELVWTDLQISRGGDFDVCYCDRHYGQACVRWGRIGSLEVNGPSIARQSIYWGNPGAPFQVHVTGRGLSLTDRLRVLPQFTLCPTAFGNATPAFEWRSGPPSFANGTHERWDTQIEAAGIFVVCWCGGDQRACSSAPDFTVSLGRLDVVTRQDCVLTDWWVVTSCTRNCGGGYRELRRGVSSQAVGGGEPCPGPEELYKTEICNTVPCPLARIDDTKTEPMVVYTMSPFVVHVTGHWFDPTEDKILIVDAKVECGSTATESHFGGANCNQEGSSSDLLLCGDGDKSIRLQRPGEYKVCICDASAARVTNSDGTKNLTTGSSEFEGLLAAGCGGPTFFTLTSSVGSVIEVLEPPVEVQEDDGGPSAFLLAGLGAAGLICCVVLIICCLQLYWWQQRQSAAMRRKSRPEERKELALEEGLDHSGPPMAPNPVYTIPAPPLVAPTPPDLQALAWYEAGFTAGAATTQTMLPPPPPPLLQLTDASPLVANQGLMEPTAPPSSFGPLALGPPPPSTGPPGGAGNRRTFGDLVSEAQRRPTTPPQKNFAQVDLSPLPTPTQTPRTVGGDTTPRAGTPRTSGAAGTPGAPLALEDGRPGTPQSRPGTADTRPGTADSRPGTADLRPGTADSAGPGGAARPSSAASEQMRPVSSGSAFSSDNLRPSTGDSDAGAASPKPEAQSKRPAVGPLALPARGSAPPVSGNSTTQLSGIEEHPRPGDAGGEAAGARDGAASSRSSGGSNASLALSESTAAGGAHGGSRKLSGASLKRGGKASESDDGGARLTQSALKAHESAMKSSPGQSPVPPVPPVPPAAAGADGEEPVTPRTEVSARTPRAVTSLLGRGLAGLSGMASLPPLRGAGKSKGGAALEPAGPPSTLKPPEPPSSSSPPEETAAPPKEPEPAADPPKPPETTTLPVPPVARPEVAPPSPSSQPRPLAPPEPGEDDGAEAKAKEKEPEPPSAPPAPPPPPEPAAAPAPTPPAPPPAQPQEAAPEAVLPPAPPVPPEASASSSSMSRPGPPIQPLDSTSLRSLRQSLMPPSPSSSNEGELLGPPMQQPEHQFEAPPAPPAFSLPPSPSSKGPGPALDASAGGRRSPNTLKDWAADRRLLPGAGSRSQSEAGSETEGEGRGAPRPPPNLPPQPPGMLLSPGGSAGPGPNLGIDTDLEDTIHSMNSSTSAKSGSPSGGRRNFSLGKLAASSHTTVRQVPKPQSPMGHQQGKPPTPGARRPLSAVHVAPGRHEAFSRPEGVPPPPPPPMPKPGMSPSPSRGGGGPKAAW